jgi:hypothetical protein
MVRESFGIWFPHYACTSNILGTTLDLESDVLSLVLSHAMNSLSSKAKAQINYDALLPAIIKCIYFSKEGFQSGYFLPTIDHDIVVTDDKLAWPSKSNSFLELQERSARPLFVSMSKLAQLAGAAIQNTNDIAAVMALLESIRRFSDTMASQWKTNRLSAIPQSEEATQIDEESLKATVPVVWQILKTVLFTTALILQELTARVIQSHQFCNKESKPPESLGQLLRSITPSDGPIIASKILHILYGYYFITIRMGPNAFSSYNFVYYTSLDLLTSQPLTAEKFLLSISPAAPGTIPPALPDRLKDLYFLNTTEHLTSILPASVISATLIPSLSPYLDPTLPPVLRPHFEAAHSVMLSILSSPTSSEIAATTMPFYVDCIFRSFPQALSARQFRLAFSTLIAEASPPQPLASLHPNLVDVLLELLCQKIGLATTTPLEGTVDEGAVGLSERDVAVLAMIDALPLMEIGVMKRWLERAADLVVETKDEGSKQRLKERFWDVISGELDVSRAEVAVRWWGEGGRDRVLFGKEKRLQVRPRL